MGHTVEYIGSYIQELDRILGGGFPRGSRILITGAPGTMKTSLAYSILYNNAFADELFGREPQKGLYFSIEQNCASIFTQTRKMGMDMTDEGKLKLIGAPWQPREGGTERSGTWEELERESWPEFLKRWIKEQVESHNARILVIDSLTAMMDRIEGPMGRGMLFDLFDWVGGMSGEGTGGVPLTTFFIVEQEVLPTSSVPKASYVADGIIHLFNIDDAHIRRQYLQCDKMRLTEHDRDYYQMEFNDGRFNLNPVVLQNRP